MIDPVEDHELDTIGGGGTVAEVVVEFVNTAIKLVLRPFTTEG